MGGVTYSSFAQKYTPKYLRENDKSLLQYTSRATDDGWLEFNAQAEPLEAKSFSTRFAKSLGLQDGYQLRLVKDKTDIKETRHQHYQLYWKNALVENGHLSLHSRKGNLTAAHSRIIDGLDIATDKAIPEIQALSIALADRKLTLADTQDKKPKSELVLTSVNNSYQKESYRLAYFFDIYNSGKGTIGKIFSEPERIYVDAVSGIIIKRVSLIESCFSNDKASSKRNEASLPANKPALSLTKPQLAATFNSLYPRSNPSPSFEVEPSGSGFRLSMSTNIGQALQTRRDQNNNAFLVFISSSTPNLNDAWDDPDLTNSSINWGSSEQVSTLAHWATWRSYQYFLNRYGVNGTDGQGTIARVLISPGFQPGPTWFKNERIMVVGPNPNTGVIASSVDIVAHEYGHGVSNHLVAGWWNTNPDTRALQEGFSDIIGTAIERELYPTGGPNDIWNYRLGEDVWYVRNMASPHDFNHPETYQEPGF